MISTEHCQRRGKQLGLVLYGFCERKKNQGVRTSGTIETESTISKSGFTRQKAQELKQKWTEERMYGQLLREMEKVDKDKS